MAIERVPVREGFHHRVFGVNVITIPEREMDLVIGFATDNADRLRLETLTGQLNGSLRHHKVSLSDAGIEYVLSSPEFTVGVEKSNSKTSSAIYIARSEFTSPAVLIQYLGQGMQTSFHYHEQHVETYCPLSGNTLLETVDEKGNESSIGKLDRETLVKPWTPHRVIGGEGGSLVAIITSGSPDCFDMSDHHYITSPENFRDHHLPRRPTDI